MVPSADPAKITVLDELGMLRCSFTTGEDGKRGLVFSRQAVAQSADVAVARPAGTTDDSIRLVIQDQMGLIADPDGGLHLSERWPEGVALFGRYAGATIRLHDVAGRRLVLRDDGTLALRAEPHAACQEITLTDASIDDEFTGHAWRRKLVLAIHAPGGLAMLVPDAGNRVRLTDRPALWTVDPWKPASNAASRDASGRPLPPQYRLASGGVWLAPQGPEPGPAGRRLVGCTNQPDQAARVEFRRHPGGWFQLFLDGQLLHIDTAHGECFLHAADRPAARFDSGARFDDLPLLWLTAPGGATAMESLDGAVAMRPRRGLPAQTWLRHAGQLVSLADGRCLAWTAPAGTAPTALRLDEATAARTSWHLGRTGLAPAELPGWLALPDATGRLELRQAAMVPGVAQWELHPLPDPGRAGGDSFAVDAPDGSLFTLVSQATGLALTAPDDPDQADGAASLSPPAARPGLTQLWAIANHALVAASGHLLRHDEAGALTTRALTTGALTAGALQNPGTATADRWVRASDRAVWRAADDWSVLLAEGKAARVAAFDPLSPDAARWHVNRQISGARLLHTMRLPREAPRSGNYHAVGGLALRCIPGSRNIAFACLDVAPPVPQFDLVSGILGIDANGYYLVVVNVRDKVKSRASRPTITAADKGGSTILFQSLIPGEGEVAMAVPLATIPDGKRGPPVSNADYAVPEPQLRHTSRPVPVDPLTSRPALGGGGRLVDIAGAPPTAAHLLAPLSVNGRHYILPARVWHTNRGAVGRYTAKMLSSFPLNGEEWTKRSPACVQWRNEVLIFCLSLEGMHMARLPGAEYLHIGVIAPARLPLDGLADAADVAAAVSGDHVVLAFSSHGAIWSCRYDPASHQLGALRRLPGTEGSNTAPALAIQGNDVILGWTDPLGEAVINFYRADDLTD